MTTIAYRDGVIAADTSFTVNGSILPGRVKIARANDGRLIGAVGKSGYGDTFKAWAMKEEGEAPKVPEEAAGFIIDLDGSVRIWDSEEGQGPFKVHPPYFAVGSGQDVALGAMYVGADAEKAVRAAIAHDKGTNGNVLVLRRE